MLTPAMLRSGTLRWITDESITAEDVKERTRDRIACALHLADCCEHQRAKLQSLRMVGEDLGPLRR